MICNVRIARAEWLDQGPVHDVRLEVLRPKELNFYLQLVIALCCTVDGSVTVLNSGIISEEQLVS